MENVKNHDSDIIEFPEQKIIDVDMKKEVERSFIEYSMSVIASRALPDVRDGMKPGQRRILYAMYEDHLTSDKPFRKSATTVGNVLGRYHPHGDAAVYGTMVRMAQDFSYRYTLVEGHGNFGSVDGDGAAAYRYTEARLSKISDELMRDLDKNVVVMTKNFDNRLDEPTVLPARFPNLLVNGSVGIAVGMATNIPTHNLGEVIDGTIYRMDNPECSVEELMEYIKGPDFPTGATVYGVNGIIEAYKTGRGRIIVRAKANIEEDHRRIVFTEIPYMVNKSTLCESIGNLVNEKRIEGITDIRDESGRGGMRIVIEYRRDANAQVILNQLYKYTQLQDTFAANMLALVNNEPKTLSLPEILDLYIEHQESVIKRRTQYDLDKALARQHILEGYKIANDNIDEIVELMKTSKSIPDSKERLMERYSLSELQAQAIVEMTLGRLTGLERQKIEDELARLAALIADLRDILANEWRVKDIIKSEMLEIKRKFADERRTEILPAEEDILLEDLIERHECVITLTHAGYVKRQPADTYSAQNRGGKGIIGMTTKEEDFIEKVIGVHSHSYLMFFTNIGKVYMKKAYQIPEASRTAKGTFVKNIIELEDGEKVTAMISVPKFNENEYLVMVTKHGIIKKTLLSEYEYQRKLGKKAINLDEGDELVFVMRTEGTSNIVLATRDGMATRFDERNVRKMGRVARGVRGIKLRDGDYVVGVAVVDESKKILTITENGFGKRCEFSELREMKNRGGYGVRIHKLSEKTGQLTGVAVVDEDSDIMLITDQGQMIRVHASDVSVYSRTAGGVIIMRLSDGQHVVNLTKVAKDEPEDEVAPASESLEAEELEVTEAIEEAEEIAQEAEELESTEE